jgi:hypothetical protein
MGANVSPSAKNFLDYSFTLSALLRRQLPVRLAALTRQSLGVFIPLPIYSQVNPGISSSCLTAS